MERPTISPLTKSVYRNGFRTLLSLLLFTAVLLLMHSQALEYVGAAEEHANALDAYFGSGTVERTPVTYMDPAVPGYFDADKRVADTDWTYQTLPYGELEEIAGMDYVDSMDARVMTAGVSDAYCRLDDGVSFYNYTTRCVIRGTFAGLKEGDPARMFDGEAGMNKVILEDCALLAGVSPWEVEGRQITVFGQLQPVEGFMGVSTGLKRLTALYDASYIYDTAYMEQLRVGEQYVFVVRYEPAWGEAYYLADAMTTRAYEPIWHVDGHPDWNSDPAFAPLVQLMQIIDADARTFDMVYTEDMASIPKFAEGRMVIVSGRALTQSDSDGAARVCVISMKLATAYGLGVGDMLTFDLGNALFEQYKGLGAQALLPQRFSAAETAVDLEIVGVYTDLDNDYTQAQQPNWYYSVNTVFLPKSIIHETGAVLDGHFYAPSECSFKVRAEHIRAFQETTLPALERMGYTVLFDDHGWPEMERDFQQAKATMKLELGLYCAAVALVIVLGIYLHIPREKKNYAILRALGTPRKLAFRRLLTPFLLIFGVCALVSALVALFGKPLTFRPLAVLLGCVVLELALACAGALVMLWRMERKPLLVLLQGGKHGK